MAPYGTKVSASIGSGDSSLDSSYFNGLSTVKDSETLGTFEGEDETFSVRTPSVNGDSVGSFSMDDSTINHSVQTPSVQDNDDTDSIMDQSMFGSVIDSVIHSIVGKKNVHPTKMHTDVIVEEDEEQVRDEQEDDQREEMVSEQVMEEEYDNFLNDFSNQSVDIMRKRSIGLVQVMSTIDQDQFLEESEEEEEEELFTPTEDNVEPSFAQVIEPDLNLLEANYQRSVASIPSVPSINSNRTKSTKKSRGSFRSRKSRATGKKGIGRRGLSPKPSRSKSKDSFLGQDSIDDSTIGDVSSPSIAFSADTSQASTMVPVPVTMGRNKFAKGGGNVSKKDLETRRDIELLLSVKKYEEMLVTIHANPKLLAIQANQPSGKTFLHVLASMPVPPPETIILKVVSVDTSLVAVTDNNNNTPLHFAAQHVRKGNMHAFTVLLKFHPMGASERNSDGDLPLHIVTSHPARGAEEAAHLLLETHPRSITEPNNKGKIPLHLALSEGSKNLKLLLKILKLHKFRKSDVDVLDNKGNSPLHCAILNGTRYEAVDLFNREMRDSNLSAYMKENEQGYIPLHLALTTSRVEPLIILSLIKAAPFTAGMATPGGDMPVALATKSNMKPEIVKLLLASDLPIELGNKNGKAGMGAIVEREHGHSWWHVAVECQSRYVDVITSLLSDHATFVQIVALARCLGPDKKTLTIDVTSAPLEAGLKNLLRFYHRYEISMARMPVCSNEIQSFAARDHGEELEKMKVTGPWLNNGFTTIEEDDHKRKADNKACEIEFVPWNKETEEVTLRCYAFDDSFDSEKRYREDHNISSKYFENINKIHTVRNYVNASFTSGKLLCIAFEKSDQTAHELMEDEKARVSRNWLVKCHLVLKDVAACLNHLHNESLIHGSLDSKTVAQFQSKWKLMYIGQSVKMGNAMGGPLRRCIPPESLSGKKPVSNFKPPSGLRDKKISRKKGSVSRSVATSRSKLTSNRSRGGLSDISTMKGLPPLPAKAKSSRKKFGIFVFGMKDLGLGSYGRGRTKSKGSGGKRRGASVSGDRSIASSVDSDFGSVDDGMSETDEGSLRIIAMQEDEIARLRQALEEKEHIYRRQLIEERAAFKRQEVERQRELQKTRAKMLTKAKESLFRYAPEKVMASPSWDIWSFGLLMAELILGETPLLPSFAASDDDFIEKLTVYGDMQVAAIREEVREHAGDLAADLVARLLHPKPQQRIESISKVLQHKYFHEEIVEMKQIFTKGKKKSSSKKMKAGSTDVSQTDSYVNAYKGLSNDRGREVTKTILGSASKQKKNRSISRRRLGK